MVDVMQDTSGLLIPEMHSKRPKKKTKGQLPESKMPKGYNERDFNFSKLFKCVNCVGTKVMSDVTQAMFAHESINCDEGNMTLGDYLEKEQKWSKSKIKDKVTKLHKHYLESKINEVDFDISFAHTMITEAFPNLDCKIPNDFRQNIDRLKTLRNKICHKYGIHADALDTEIDNLKVMLEKIYQDVVETVLKQDVSEKIEEMKQALEGIRSAKVRQDDIETYLEDVRKFREDLKFKMIAEGREEVFQYYSQLKILNPCTWLTEDDCSKTSLSKYQIDKIFTPLKIEDSRSGFDIESLLSVTKSTKGEKMKPSVLLLVGHAGCGKTSLSHYILHQWSGETCEMKDLKDFDLVLFVEIRRVCTKDLREFLRESCMRKTCRSFDPDDIIPTLQDMDVLFVIDGYDECKKVAAQLVDEIFCKFNENRIVLTTRDSHRTDVAYLARKHRASFLSIEICGFDEKGIKLFSEKVFKAIEPDEAKCQIEIKDFQSYLDGRGRVLDEHLKLPLTLALLIYLWREDHDIVNKVTTATRLYLEIFKLCQKRLKERLTLPERNKLDGILDELLICLGQQAWRLLVEGNMVCLTEKALEVLKRECTKRLVDVLELLSAYLCCETDENTDKSNCIFAFLHRTQMEYLSGAYLATAVTTNKLTFNSIDKYVCDAKSEWRNHQEVLKFWSGHLAITKELKHNGRVPEIFCLLHKADIGYGNYSFWWNFYLETLKNSEVGEHIRKDMLPKYDWQLDTQHVVEGMELYYATRVKLETIKITIPTDKDPYDIKDLLVIMSKIQNQKRKDKKSSPKNKIDPVKVELHFWNHDEYESVRTSADFIRTLNPWGHLTNFTGSLGEEEVLSYCFNLKTIRVRLNSAGAVKAFKASLSRIHKNVRTLRITLGLPFSCNREEICDLQYNGKLEITLKGLKDENASWLEGVLKTINGKAGCRRLSLLNSEFQFDAIKNLLKRLKGVVHEKLSIQTVHTPSDAEKEALKKVENSVHIEINWLDE